MRRISVPNIKEARMSSTSTRSTNKSHVKFKVLLAATVMTICALGVIALTTLFSQWAFARYTAVAMTGLIAFPVIMYVTRMLTKNRTPALSTAGLIAVGAVGAVVAMMSVLVVLSVDPLRWSIFAFTALVAMTLAMIGLPALVAAQLLGKIGMLDPLVNMVMQSIAERKARRSQPAPNSPVPDTIPPEWG